MLVTPINRHYVRTGNWSITAIVSKADTQQWSDASVKDIAAGGLLFLTDMQYQKGDLLRFDLQIDPMAPGISRKIRIKASGEIIGDRGIIEGRHAFSVRFTEISRDDRIRIDELVRLTNYQYKESAGLDP